MPTAPPRPRGSRATRLGAALLTVMVGACAQAAPAGPRTGSGQVAVLPCQDVVGSDASPPPGFTVILGRVALPTGLTLQAVPSGDSDPAARLFAKVGLVVRRGASFDLLVAPGWQGRVTFGWGSPARRTDHLRVPGCRPTGAIDQPSYRPGDAWLVYAGGFWLPRPACVSVSVRAATSARSARIGVGAPCPRRLQRSRPSGSGRRSDQRPASVS